MTLKHRNGCTGCDHDRMAYPPCWTDEQVRQHGRLIMEFQTGGTVKTATERSRNAIAQDLLKDEVALKRLGGHVLRKMIGALVFGIVIGVAIGLAAGWAWFA